MECKMVVVSAFLCAAMLFSACRHNQKTHTQNCNAVELAAFALSCMPTNASFTNDFSIHLKKSNTHKESRGIHLTKSVFQLDVQSNDTHGWLIGRCHIYCNTYGEPIYSIWEENKDQESSESQRKAFSYCALALSLYANNTTKHETWNASISLEEKRGGIIVIIEDLDNVGFDTPLFVFKDGWCYHTHGE